MLLCVFGISFLMNGEWAMFCIEIQYWKRHERKEDDIIYVSMRVKIKWFN